MLFQMRPMAEKGTSSFDGLLPPVEAVDRGRLQEVLGNGTQRLVKTEGHVPGLAREDHDDRRQFQAHVAIGEKGHQGQHQGRHEAQNWNALQDVQQGNEDLLGHVVLGRPVSIGEGEQEGYDVGQEATAKGVEGVLGKGPGGEVDAHRGAVHPRPFPGDFQHAEDQADEPQQEGQVHPPEFLIARDKSGRAAPYLLEG